MLAAVHPVFVLSSPRQRAVRTAELAGLAVDALDDDLVEWDYGDYEGRTRAEIRTEIPGWSPWTHPDMPNGERLDQVADRAQRVVDRVRSSAVADALLFAHGHLLRMVAVTWIDAPWPLAWRLPIDPATVSVLGWDRGTAVLERWNS
jgi:probable phosphoglycerate mutase